MLPSLTRQATFRLGICLLPAILLTLPVQAAEQQKDTDITPRDWLVRMSDAVRQRHYEGTFVYSHGGELEAMRLVHRADENGGAERLVSLSGEPREIIRNGDIVKCFLPGREAVIVERGQTAMPLPAAHSLQDPALQKHYEFLDMGESRIAGRPCKLIGIKPRDEYRYGYRLCLDKKTALPLQSELMTPKGEVIEQVMFTHLDLPKAIPVKALQTQVAADDFTWHVRHEISPAPLAESLAEPAGDKPALGTASGISLEKRMDPAWQAQKLPPGFVITHSSMERAEDSPRNPKTHSWHMVYSDGLASISVFVEPTGNAPRTLSGAAHLGAVNAYGRELENWQLTVVGEVPAETVEMVARSLEHTQ